MYGLTNQMKKSSSFRRQQYCRGEGEVFGSDFAVFLCHACGSLHQLETQFLIARELGHVREEGMQAIEASTAETGKMLNGLIDSMRPKLADRKSA
jgi:four helix bundle protein